ncbi:acid phosphatase [Pseudomonas protegens]|uniref:acid phosphatase n=1 Tax=Pseudomonas protegens TaxID=380021 RepID=UPI000F4A8A5C|nr:acid phosphatase [Pseudomonas protegens]ROL93157.1 acid phosphatase [Pseudomonas protegens]ROL99329.1 acid phosphatase [Pseudomonas protegens]ROM09358.1 acid phosphatase [Pseudomonas protegens]ROM11919.1 acid phosphatase [Pseudomonas protegens]
MSDDTDQRDTPETNADQPTDTSRRRFLGGVAVLGVGATLSACSKPGEPAGKPDERPLSPTELDKALRDQVKNVVVLFAENRSFNNLFANFPGVEKPLSALKPEAFQQRDRDGSLLSKLPPIWGGILQVGPQTLDGITYPVETQFQENLPNAPFALKGPSGEDLPLGLVTRDLWHVFYQNQMQINGGKNDGFVAWADSGALTMGHYAQTRYSLRLWDVAREFVLCDNFFQGAFGGSFLNHQYLISAKVPFYPDAANSVAKSQIATLQGDDPKGTRLKPLDKSPASAMDGAPQFGPSALTPDGYAVNTMAPPYWPTWIRDPERPDYAKPDLPSVLVPQTHEHIGDKLSKKNVDWAWYGGAWQATLEQFKDSGGIPKIPNFQYHHQPFNYFVRQGPENPAERAKRLRDGGLGDESSTNKFFADAEAGKLPAVTFYKPQGNLNLHAGYADVAAGDRHIDRALKVLRESPQWKNMVVIVTVDENGGWWDHVAPPQGDRWGPGTRIPALVVSPFARKGTVDHTVYDTASILRLITRVFQLETLDGIKERDEAMIARGQKPMGDLTNALHFSV